MGDFVVTLGSFGGVLSLDAVFFAHFLGPRQSKRTEGSDPFGAGAHQGDLS